MGGLVLGVALFAGLVTWDLHGLVPDDVPQSIAETCVDSVASEHEDCVIRGLRELLGGIGYLDAVVETVTVDTHRTLEVLAGRRYSLERLVIDGVNAPAGKHAVRPILAMEGRRWDGKELTRQFEYLLEAYENNGYPFASISVRHISADHENATLSARIGVREGPLTHIESIRVSKGARTKPHVAARLAGLRLGMLYRQHVLDQVERRLLNTGYFSSVSEPRLTSGSGPGNIAVEIDIEEGPTHRLHGAVGLSQEGALAGSFDLQLRNIAGTAREVRFAWESSGTGRSDVFLAYKEPWVLGLPPALTVEVQQIVEDTVWVERSGRVGLSWELGKGFTGALGYATRRVIPGESAVGIVPTRTNEGWGQAVWDRERRLGLWETGYRFRLWTAYQQRQNLETGDKIPQVPVELDAIRHVPLHGHWSLGFSAGWRQLVTAEKTVPVPDQYPLGGARTLRGYREKQFRSKAVGWLRTEYRVIPDRRTSLFLFMDTGFYLEDESWESRRGFGLGIRVDTALGIMELDYGIPEGVDLLDGRIHLALGREF